MKEQSQTIVEQLSQLAELSNASLKKELNALVDLMIELKVTSVTELKKPVFEAIKQKKSSPTEFVKRAQQFRNQTERSIPTDETIDELIFDFEKMTTTNIKSIAKKLGITLLSKADSSLFAEWLETGRNPPTEEEKCGAAVQVYIEKAVKVKNDVFDDSIDVSHGAIATILEIAEFVKKEYKFPGLKALLSGFNLTPSGKTAASAIKDLKTFLYGIQADHFKAKETSRIDPSNWNN